jgi:hypothetical protein
MIITQLGDDARTCLSCHEAAMKKLHRQATKEKNSMSTLARLALAALAFVATLGPMGANAAFTVANVKGNYGFRFSGTDYASTGRQIVATGIFFADGAGNITGKGSITYNDGGSICTGTTVNSTYTVVADGEGILNLQYALSGTCPLGPVFTFAIALASPSGGIAKIVQLSSTKISVNSDVQSPLIPVVGEADFL